MCRQRLRGCLRPLPRPPLHSRAPYAAGVLAAWHSHVYQQVTAHCIHLVANQQHLQDSRGGTAMAEPRP